MIDYGLVVSLILSFGAPALLARRWPIEGPDGPVGFLDVAVGPAFVGLAVGRLTALALDDPASLGSFADLIVIRSGVEFWPGVAAAAGYAALSARLGQVPVGRRLTDLAPLAMAGYAAYEAGCVFRDGCYGPESAVGIGAPGVSTTMIPVGLVMAVAVMTGAVVVHTMGARGSSPALVVTSAVLIVAFVRAIGSIWLPHVGDGLTRQHLESVVMVAVAVVAAVAVGLRDASGRADQQATR